MIIRVPDYYEEFECLASACPHNCCIGWEVAVDDAAAAYFKAVPGPFGARVRAALTADGEGQRCFVRTDGRRCPLLDSRNLCEVQLRLGAEHTGEVCRTHPRFTEDYGAARETSLAASCPAVCRLLLGSREQLRFPGTRTPEADAPWTSPLLEGLLAVRAQALEILCCRSLSLKSRMEWFLLLANDAQALLDDDRRTELPDLCGAYATLEEEPELELAPGPGIFPRALETMEALEHLEPDWAPLLSAARAAEPGEVPDWAGERILCYFVFRWLLKAVGDGDLLSRAELAVFGFLTVRRLAGMVPLEDALSRYCREIEHSRENLDALRQTFCTQLDLAAFLREVRTL